MSDTTSTLGPEYFHPDGRRKSLAERQAERSKAAGQVRDIKEQVAKITAPVESHEQRIHRTNVDRIEELSGELRWCLPSEREGKRNRIQQLKKVNADLEDKMRDDQRKAEYASDKRVTGVRDSASAIERSWKIMYPHANPEDVALAVELAKSSSLPAAELHDQYWQIMDRISSQNLAAEQRAAVAAEQAAARAAADHAQAELRRAEAQLRQHQANQQLGGDTE